MVWPSLWQYGALPAGSSWQLQERSLPGGSSEVLRQVWSSYYLDYVCLICCFQLHVLNGWIKSGLWNWSLLGISVGWRTGTCHFQCRYLKLENGRGADFCTSYHLGLLQLNNWEHWAGCSIENIGTLSWRLNWGHMNIGTPISELEFSGPFMECTLDDGGVLWAGGSIVNISTESWA